MDVYALLDAMGGEIVRNRARVRIDGQIVVVAELENGALVLNEAGRRAVNQATSEVVEVKKPRKPRVTAVESEPTAPIVAEEGAPVEAAQPDATPAE